MMTLPAVRLRDGLGSRHMLAPHFRVFWGGFFSHSQDH